jgi:hypothetical protein
MARNALKPAFRIAANTLVFAKGVYEVKTNNFKDRKTYPAYRGLCLTEREAFLLKGIFGAEIDTARIRKRFAPKDHPLAEATALNAREVKFYGEKNRSQDYSRDKNPFLYFLFIHEMTHLWQYQHPLRDFARTVRNPTTSHDYKLSRNARFRDFGAEQQANIVADYALQFLYPHAGAQSKDGLYQPEGAAQAQSLALLKKVVEDRFPQARKTRLNLERKGRAPCPS